MQAILDRENWKTLSEIDPLPDAMQLTSQIMRLGYILYNKRENAFALTSLAREQYPLPKETEEWKHYILKSGYEQVKYIPYFVKKLKDIR